MSSKSIHESLAKAILYNSLSESTISRNPSRVVTDTSILDTDAFQEFSALPLVAKPDVLLKRRGKLGLVLAGKSLEETKAWLKDRVGTSFQVGRVTGTLSRFLVEPFVPHEQSEEYYICMYTERESNVILFHHEGGVNVGAVDEKAKRFEIPVSTMLSREAASQPVCTPDELLESSLFSDVDDMQRRRILAEFVVDLHRVFDKLHFTFLEINPLVVCGWTACGGAKSDNLFVHILDVAAKLDQCAEFLFSANSLWSPQGQSLEFPFPFGRIQTPEEAHIAELDARTGASMKLSVLNPNGRIWTMSAGGGASVIYADTVCALAEQVKQEQGKGNGALDLANYGEYSGAPSEGQTYEYAKTILALMTRGNPHPDGKILLIGGGIANFTNVAATFKGIMRALMEFKSELQRHNVRVFVRRAGPNYQEGLRIMRELGLTLEIPIHVFGPETHMTAIVSMAFGLRSIVSSKFDQKTGTEALMSATTGSCDTTLNETVGDNVSNGFGGRTHQLFHSHSRCIVWGLQVKAVQSMLDFDYASHRETPSVAALVYPFSDPHNIKVYWGSSEIFLPVYKTLSEASMSSPDAEILINFGSLRVAYDVTMEAISLDPVGPTNNKNGACNGLSNESQFNCIAIIAEGIPEQMTRRLICRAKQRNVLIIGPATVGGVKAGCFKIGNTGGMVDNILSTRLYRPGSVAYVSRSGGMSNELNNIISKNSDGVEEGVAIGGDRYPGSTFLDHVLRFEANPQVAMIVLLGEVGGIEEYAIAEAVKSGRIRKPVVAWCIGTCAQLLAGSAESIQFGHAGACANSIRETATAKNAALSAAGVHVPSSFDSLDAVIRQVFDSLVQSGKWVPKPDTKPRPVPLDYSWAKELGLIRRPAAFTSTICDDRGSELLFAGIPISQVITEDLGIGGVLGLLWFKRRLPSYMAKFLELCLVITADHGPAVSGALNTIVTARAGKDLLSCLTAGLLTIGDRFGGALDGAARQFAAAFDAGLSPAEFVASERKASRLIMGIGHRVKSITNPDMRVHLLSDFVHQHFPATPLVDYAFAVEKVTTSKRPNLILNVDGMIGVAMVDLLRHSGLFTRQEAEEYVNIGTLNGLFVLGRSIGFIGHYLDQKRLHQGLYRHPWEDISYVIPELSADNDHKENSN
ncbi:ATP-citrate synthase [Clonorchis sinensis]|uniref:ATP-citrate synthase n=1 Tax=Clonorchis sinensis TaxID=79923 RepID=A0A8T1LXF6_CLOSI|nr:ATP-citrate synthase [Clonorchis sinensis]